MPGKSLNRMLIRKHSGIPPTRSFIVAGIGVITALATIGCGDKGGQPPPASKETVQRGAELYSSNCQVCHGGATGGNLRDLPPPHNANGHTWHHPDKQLIDIVLNGFAFSVEEQKMPAFKDKLSEEDVGAILAYIKTWWTDEQREWQAAVTAQEKEMRSEPSK